jgi:tetratricopeptide (TPR) repeat protein
MLEEKYNELMAIDDPKGMPAEEALGAFGTLVDISFMLRRSAGGKSAIANLEKLRDSDLNPEQRMRRHYFLGNAWNNIRVLEHGGRDTDWDWEYQELEKEISHLHRALRASEDAEVPEVLLCQAYTNLGNAYNSAGRFVEAIDQWNAALSLDPDFHMATANKGQGFLEYARRALYDRGQAALFLKAAHQLLSRALKGSLEPGAPAYFAGLRSQIEAALQEPFLKEDFDLDKWDMGASPEESAYRKWCLTERLFLNPLNDLGPHTIAARDVLLTPPIILPAGNGPYYQGFYNQMKQEYATARHLLYEGLHAEAPHYSDRAVLLFNTLDYPSYCRSVELQKLALRSAYSILDKIAFFLNHYLALGFKPHQVSLKGLWYLNRDRRQGLRPEFQRRRNWPLRGLFWLSKDLFDNRPGFGEATDPDAARLAEIRNHLEHKYLKVHDDSWPGPFDFVEGMGRALSDTLAHSIRRRELRRLALKMLGISRAALIYLSLGVHVEEKGRAAERGPEVPVLPMPLGLWDDDWKK